MKRWPSLRLDRVVLSGAVRLGLASVGIAVAAAVALSSSSCGLPLAAPSEGSANVCVDDSSCSADETCKQRGSNGGICESTSVRLGTVVLEVKSGDIAHLTEIQLPGDEMSNVSLTIPGRVDFVGAMHVDGDTTGCAGADGTIPAKAELRSVLPYAALSSTYYAPLLTPDDPGGFRFGVPVPPGTYDIYVKPDVSRDGCAGVNATARFFGSVDVRLDTTFTVDNKTPLEFVGTALVAPGFEGAPTGWQMELVEPKYGLPISNTIVLGEPDADGKIDFKLKYTYHSKMVLRLSRPDDKFAIHWQVEGALDPSAAMLDLSTLVSKPVQKTGSVRHDPLTPLRAAVTIQSIQLDGKLGQGASFRLITESNAQGDFTVDLIPGKYQVSVAPLEGSQYATLTEEWEISKDSGCCGTTFAPPLRPQVTGRVVRQDGTPFGFTTVAASAPLTSPADDSFFQAARFAEGLLPQQATASADADGTFSLLADPGTLDITVRPSASSYYPWLVVPSYLLQTSFDMGDLTLRGPAVLTGTVAEEGKSGLGGARLRAYVVTDASDTGKTSVVLVGETITDGSGGFELFLPPELTTFQAPE